MTRPANDTIVTGPAVPGMTLRLLLVAVVAAAAMVLCPVLGWRVAAIVLAVVAAFIPQTFAAWGSVACLVVGMSLSEPDLGRTMIAVLTVNLVAVLTSLLLVVTARTRVLLRALRPTALRLILVQSIAQPVTVVVLLTLGVSASAVPTMPWVAAAGAAALALVSALLVLTVNRVRHREADRSL